MRGDGGTAARPRAGTTRSAVVLQVAMVVAFVGLLAAACSKADTPSSGATPGSVADAAGTRVTVVPDNEGTPKDGGSLVFGVSAEPDGFYSPVNQFAATSVLMGSSMIETVTAFDADGSVKPYLAESMEPTDLAAKWTIKVRPNIKFHDGSALDASVIKANLEEQKKGLGAIGLVTLQELNVVDPMTLEVKMTQPWASFPSILAGSPGLMYSPKTLGTDEAQSHPVGTGPFMFDHWNRGTEIGVKKNPNYWQAGKPHLDSINFRIFVDPDSRSNALQSGDLDVMTTEEPGTIIASKKKPEFKVIVDDSGDAEQIFMNEARPPFDNINARKAVVLATDPAAVVETIGSGLLKPIDQPFADRSPYHQPDPHYPAHDLAAAKQAADKYTAETGKPIEFTLTIFTGSTNLKIGQILQQQWAQAGINAKVNSVEQATAIKDIISGQLEAQMGANFGYPDPDLNYIFWHSSYTAPIGQLSLNFPHTKLDNVDKALLEGRVNLIPAKRQEAYKQAIQYMNENFVYVWLYRYVAAVIANDRVKGLKKVETDPFSSLANKTWYGDLWVDHK